MELIRNSILKCLYNFVDSDDDDELICEFNRIIEKEGKQAYPVIFHVLTYLDLETDKAEECWQKVIAHRELMRNSLGRKVNLRTAICDYFCSVNKCLKSPIVVEIRIFEKKTNISKYDYLTGLYSRAAFDESLERELSRSKRHETELSVLFLDIDDFKKINDSFGHLAGDAVLKNVAVIIMDEIRAEDIAARYGGDEIVIILPETGKALAIMVGERIRKKVEEMGHEYRGHLIRLTMSGGIASFPTDANDALELLKCADDALYKGKHYGKNNIILYSQNRRRYFRIDFIVRIGVRKINFTEVPTLKAVSKNISVGGILFESESPFDIGAKIQIRIPLERPDEPLLIIGIVVRVELFDSGRYDIGVSFIEMDKSAKHEISQYLMRQLELGNVCR